VIEHYLSRWHREVGGKVVLLRDQPWLLVQNRCSPPLSILFEAPACSCQADAAAGAVIAPQSGAVPNLIAAISNSSSHVDTHD